MRRKRRNKPEPSAVEKAIAPGPAKKEKRHRPKIPDSVALAVAMRQGVACAITGDLGFEGQMQLDHNPALINRKYDPKTKTYDPPANSIEHLQWVLRKAHVEKTGGNKITRRGSDMHIRDHTDAMSASHRKHLEAMRRKTFGGTS